MNTKYQQKLAQFKIKTLTSGFSFEIWFYEWLDYYEEYDISHYLDLKIYKTIPEIFREIKSCLTQYLETGFNNNPFLGLLQIYLDKDKYHGPWDEFYKNYLILMSDPDDYFWIDTRNNQMFKGCEVKNFQMPDDLTEEQQLDFIKDFLDTIEEEKDRAFVPGQLSLF